MIGATSLTDCEPNITLYPATANAIAQTTVPPPTSQLLTWLKKLSTFCKPVPAANATLGIRVRREIKAEICFKLDLKDFGEWLFRRSAPPPPRHLGEF